MRVRRAWVTEHDYLGVVGADSVREMAEIACSDPDTEDAVAEILCAHSEGDDVPSSTVDAVAALFEELTVSAIRIPVPVFASEKWDESKCFPCAIEDRPGRGYVKVLGVWF